MTFFRNTDITYMERVKFIKKDEMILDMEKGQRANQRHSYIIFFIEQELKTVIHFDVENEEAY